MASAFPWIHDGIDRGRSTLNRAETIPSDPYAPVRTQPHEVIQPRELAPSHPTPRVPHISRRPSRAGFWDAVRGRSQRPRSPRRRWPRGGPTAGIPCCYGLFGTSIGFVIRGSAPPRGFLSSSVHTMLGMPTISLRVPDSDLARIDRRAAELGVTRTASSSGRYLARRPLTSSVSARSRMTSRG
jgi:hypothetical protein